MVWPTAAAILHALTEVELYGYCQGQVVDLGPMMLAAQFQVMEEGGAYLCTVRALVFEGSILAYNPALNEAEWVPVHGLANDLSWAGREVHCGLGKLCTMHPSRGGLVGAGRIISCPSDNDSTSTEEEEVQHSDTQSTDPPTDTDPEVGDESENRAGGQINPGDAVERD